MASAIISRMVSTWDNPACIHVTDKNLEKLENLADSFNGVQKSFAMQAGREIRVIVKPEVVNDANAVMLARDIAKKIENELDYPGQIKVNVIRETRSVEYAK